MKESIIRVLSSAISIAVGIGLAWLVYAVGGFSGTKTLNFLGLWFGFVAAVFWGCGLLMSDETIDAITSITESTPSQKTIKKQNIKARDSLKDNRENAKFGFVFLFLALLLQFLSLI